MAFPQISNWILGGLASKEKERRDRRRTGEGRRGRYKGNKIGRKRQKSEAEGRGSETKPPIKISGYATAGALGRCRRVTRLSRRLSRSPRRQADPLSCCMNDVGGRSRPKTTTWVARLTDYYSATLAQVSVVSPAYEDNPLDG